MKTQNLIEEFKNMFYIGKNTKKPIFPKSYLIKEIYELKEKIETNKNTDMHYKKELNIYYNCLNKYKKNKPAIYLHTRD
jgi:hypothetical protein